MTEKKTQEKRIRKVGANIDKVLCHTSLRKLIEVENGKRRFIYRKKEIAEHFGITVSGLYYWLKKHGYSDLIKTRELKQTEQWIPCARSMESRTP